MTLMQEFAEAHSHERLREPQNLLFAEPHPIPFPHLSVGKFSLGHLLLARKAKDPNGLPVDFDVSLRAVPWRHQLEAGQPPPLPAIVFTEIAQDRRESIFPPF